jgi:lipopolysaccharide/colanic/teichoic acid biosynthesis glycosyltransferase
MSGREIFGADVLRIVPGSFYAEVLKPAFDHIFGAVLLLMALPMALVLAVLVRMMLGPHVLFRQERVGRGGGKFLVLKFRTMRPDRRRGQSTDSGIDRRVCHKREDDPRHTAFGRFLRKWSLDELPQLWNVVRGDMSLVGPRPELVEIVQRYAPWQHHRHLVKPGMTGLWQISKRGNVMMHEAVEVDIEYVERLSFKTDIGILVHTIPAVMRKTGD